MHWQQYATLGGAIFSGSIFAVLSLAGPNADRRITATWQLAIVILGQWILYSGGWYNG
jgi:hypothetical protein